MEALKIESTDLKNSYRGISVSEFSKNDFKIGKYEFRWRNASDNSTGRILYIKSKEMFGDGIRFDVKNPTQLIILLATNTKRCVVCIGEEGDNVELGINWTLETEGPQLFKDVDETEE